jgi:energy-converting hydrogenase Eha subunit F
MSTTRPPSPTAYLPTAAFLFVVGWSGWLYITNFTSPELLPRWLFYFFIVVALSGTALPVTAYLNHRFPSSPPVGTNVVLRQALWFGIFASTLTWLSFGRVYSFTLAVILLLGLSAVEWLLRMRERSQWKP